jgi:hypothetical protein
MGLPLEISMTEPSQLRTVEDFYKDLDGFLDTLPGGNTPAMYVLDSLDALSDDAEVERDFDKGSYGAEKAKLLSKIFRLLVGKLTEKNCFLLVISQIRDKIGVMFGETKTRSGGHALDFYASQVVWLAQVQSLKRTVSGIERPYGVIIKAKNKKCKVGMPFRDAEFPLLFGYGIDDEVSMIKWLKDAKVKVYDIAGEGYEEKELLSIVHKAREERDRESLNDINAALRSMTLEKWNAIETELAQPISKY